MSNIAYKSPQVNNFLKNNLIPVEDFLRNPSEVLHRYLSEKQIHVLDYLTYMYERSDSVYVSQSHIAKVVKSSREWVNKTISKLCDLGLIHKEFRYRDTCLYCVSAMFDDLSIRNALSHIIRSFLWLPIKILKVNTKPPFSKSSHYSYNDLSKLLTTLTSNTLTTLNSFTSKPLTTTTKREPMKQNTVFDKKSAVLDEIGKIIPLSDIIRDVLAVYSTEVLDSAVKQLQKATGISNKVRYFLGICSRQHQQREQRKLFDQTQQQINPEQKKEHRYDLTKRSTKPIRVGEDYPIKWKKLDRAEEERQREILYAMPEWDVMKRWFGPDFKPDIPEEVPVNRYKFIKTEYGMKKVLNEEYDLI